jgi:uncharacterized protein (TIGR00730 family)
MSQQNSSTDPQLTQQLDGLIEQVGGDPDALSGKVVREIMHTALKLVRDEADDGELKLISRSLKELRYALKVFRAYRDTPKVSIFGSARTPDGHPIYQAAETFASAMAEAGWMVITGAGDGIMRAGHGGAGREASFGVAIRLPFETNANDYIEGDAKLITFRYFFARKIIFMWQADAVVLFPGGFGTQDEGFEALTLIQTGKAPLLPIVLVDEPGGHYWQHWDRYVRNELLEPGMIGAYDLNLYTITDDPQAAAEHVRQFYRVYHSQRFVHDELVLRLKQRLSARQLDALNEEFADLVAEGQICQGEAFEVEEDHRDLPRLHFTFTRKDYGRLRLMIDRINAFACPSSEPTHTLSDSTTSAIEE